MTIKEAAARARGSYKPVLQIKSKARTVSGVNAAIRRETAEPEDWFPTAEDMEKSAREGFITFHSDGFILWFDEP